MNQPISNFEESKEYYLKYSSYLFFICFFIFFERNCERKRVVIMAITINVILPVILLAVIIIPQITPSKYETRDLKIIIIPQQ